MDDRYKMKKHAYLIMAHGNWKILEKLLILLDDERNDIYLHINNKVKSEAPKFESILKQSEFHLLESINVYWADFSQVDVTLRLLNAANQSGEYSYYHLMSGQDLPIKSKDEIYSFFEKNGKEFIGIVPNEFYYSVRRVKYYHPFLHNNFYRKSKFLKVIERVFEYIQKVFGVNRLNKTNWEIIDGWTWFSITDKFCSYVLEKESLIRKMFSSSIASDELFMQTLAYNSPFYECLYDSTDLKKGFMRFIDWERGRPYTWEDRDSADFDLLMQSPYMFARKFDEKNFEIVEKIFNKLNEKNENNKI